jgi:hypothetical protein
MRNVVQTLFGGTVMKFASAFLSVLFLQSVHAAEQPRPTTDPMHYAARTAAPADVTDAQLATALSKGLKHPDGSAVAIAIPRAEASLILILIRKSDGSYVAADASQVEIANFGFFGRKRHEYERYETKPIKWLPRDDGLLQVSIQTRAWRKGQRYTVAEPLIIKPDGSVLFR